MIGLAVLQYFAAKCGLTVGKNAFYEAMPAYTYDNSTQANYGVFLVTDSGLMKQNGLMHNFFTFYICVGEGATDPVSGKTVRDKQETDRLASLIEQTVAGALADPDSYELTSSDGSAYTSVIILPQNSRGQTMVALNGAKIKTVSCEVYYKPKE